MKYFNKKLNARKEMNGASEHNINNDNNNRNAGRKTKRQ